MDDLLDLAFADPPRAQRLANEVLSQAGSDDAARSIALQALAIVVREMGEIESSITNLREALRLALRARNAERVADVRATYGATLVLSGRSRNGLRVLDRAVSEAPDVILPTILMRRATCLCILGRDRAALPDMTAAAAGLRSSGNQLWLARTLNNLGAVQLALGEVAAAESSFVESASICEEIGASAEGVPAQVNVGLTTLLRGDIPRALAIFQAIDRSQVHGRTVLNLALAASDTYLAAGLATSAVTVLEEVPTEMLAPVQRAERLLALAEARLAAKDHSGSLSAARSARTAFRKHQREWFEVRAQWTELRARYELGLMNAVASDCTAVARSLHEEGADEAPSALTLAGRLALNRQGEAMLRAAASYGSRSNPLVRASAEAAHAYLAERAGHRAGILRACGRGLAALEEHRAVMGSSELRAVVTAHGRELATLAIRHAADNPRALLQWSERWRSTVLAQPPVTPSNEVMPALAMLRENGRQLAEAHAAAESTAELRAERRRLERAVRTEHHKQTGGIYRTKEAFDVARLVLEVGQQGLVELVDVNDVLHVIVISRGRVRRRVAGSVAEALELAERGRFALRRAARGGSFDPGDLGQRLQEALLGDAVKLIPDGPVVIAPTVRLHGAPWALLPCLADRPFTLVPSAAQWLRARDVKKPRAKPLVLLSGPGLGSGGAEVPRLKRRNPDALLLRGRKATVEAALDALDGARLAHVAAHGHFRADSPLFSSLEMADGPLTVYELERLRRAPYRVVLSACESGVLAPVGAEELLGLAAALFSLGTAGMVSAIAEVRDDITADLMLKLHAGLAAGDDPANALHAVRRAAAGDPTAVATAAAFVALGT